MGQYAAGRLKRVCEDFGLEKMELMACFDAARLTEFAEHANHLEEAIRTRIIEGGGIIREYHSREEFLNEVEKCKRHFAGYTTTGAAGIHFRKSAICSSNRRKESMEKNNS